MAITKYTSTANTSWVCPRTGNYHVQCIGGGGGGATYGRTTGARGTSGGGGGAWAASRVWCIGGTTYTIAVGAGGAGGATNNANGANGGNTHFNNNEVKAAFGGRGTNAGGGGNAGLIANCVGNNLRDGGNAALYTTMTGGGGGAGAGICANGNNGTVPTGGAGGWNINQYVDGIPDQGGSGANGGASNTSGNNAALLGGAGGGGGGAGGNLGTTVKTGGNGMNGAVIITYADIWEKDTFTIFGRA